MDERNAPIPANGRIEFRIWINLGDLIEKIGVDQPLLSLAAVMFGSAALSASHSKTVASLG
jgi:hypothetical protein